MRIKPSRSIHICLLMIFGLVAVGCDSVVDSNASTEPLAAPAVAYNVEVGNSLKVDEGANIVFVELLADTRCPLEEICQDKGSVDASFILEMDGQREPFILSGFVGPEGKQIVQFDVGPYEVVMERLDPYPMEDCDMDMPPVAQLRVQR